MVVKFICYFFILLFCVDLYASKVVLKSEVGQKDFDLYYGPHLPLYTPQGGRGFNFIEDLERENYFTTRLEQQVFDLQAFFEYDFEKALSCPNYEYEKAYDYLRYLNRLLALSYIYESFFEYEYIAQKFKNYKVCHFDWNQIVNSCQPKSTLMQEFVNNIKAPVSSRDKVIVDINETTKYKREEWLNDFVKGKKKDLVQYRLSKMNGFEKSEQKLLKELSNSCQKDKDNFMRICNEQDSIYGLSQIPESFYLLMRSYALRPINKRGFAKGCLKRFIVENENKEKRINELSPIFKYLFNHYLSQGTLNERGQLFNYGALKEFTDKGLKSIITKYEKPIPKKEAQKIVKAEVFIPPKFETITLPKYVKKKESPKKIEEKKVTVRKVKTLSAFMTAVNFSKKYQLNEVAVNMEKFRFDFLFPVDQAQKYSDYVKRFSSYKALEDMKKMDKLGDKSAPVPLKFVKYMIDNKLHMNLYNVINVIGNEFYVINDLEKNKSIHHIKIKNDRSTKFKWIIYIMNTKSP